MAGSFVSRFLVAVATVAVLGAACSSDDDSSSDDGSTEAGGSADATDTADTITVPDDVEDLTGQSQVEIEVSDNRYVPRHFRVDPGAEIVFVNVGLNDHNVMPSVEGAFEAIPTGDLSPGDEAVLVLGDSGDYPIYCSIHGTPTNGQTGFIVVRG